MPVKEARVKCSKSPRSKRKILALKRIRLDGKETETVAGFIDEIKLLKTLRGRDNIIQLVDAEVCPNEKLIFMVLEFGEIDLAHMLAKREKQRQSHGGVIDDNFLRLYFEQMVEAVNTIHEERIVHSDLKPPTFCSRAPSQVDRFRHRAGNSTPSKRPITPTSSVITKSAPSTTSLRRPS